MWEQNNLNKTLSLRMNNNQNKCSDRNMKEQNPAHLGNYDRVTDRPTNQPTDGQTGS